MAYSINEKCNSCGTCVAACPQNTIKENDGKYLIDTESCTNCGDCVSSCSIGSIQKTDDEVKATSQSIQDKNEKDPSDVFRYANIDEEDRLKTFAKSILIIGFIAVFILGINISKVSVPEEYAYEDESIFNPAGLITSLFLLQLVLVSYFGLYGTSNIHILMKKHQYAVNEDIPDRSSLGNFCIFLLGIIMIFISLVNYTSIEVGYQEHELNLLGLAITIGIVWNTIVLCCFLNGLSNTQQDLEKEYSIK